jgi:integral membrane protein
VLALAPVLQTAIGRLRAISLLEGCSFLLLLGIAMPLKYFAGMPIAVKVVGWLHGVLFVMFCIALADAYRKHNWSFGQGVFAFFMALVPFGPFVLEARLKRQQQPT